MSFVCLSLRLHHHRHCQQHHKQYKKGCQQHRHQNTKGGHDHHLIFTFDLCMFKSTIGWNLEFGSNRLVLSNSNKETHNTNQGCWDLTNCNLWGLQWMIVGPCTRDSQQIFDCGINNYWLKCKNSRCTLYNQRAKSMKSGTWMQYFIVEFSKLLKVAAVLQ